MTLMKALWLRNPPFTMISNPECLFNAVPKQRRIIVQLLLCITASISILEEDVTVIVSGREIPSAQWEPHTTTTIAAGLADRERVPPDGILARNGVISFSRDVVCK
ncbi:hypothetical protein CDAR_258651 [Caerostris darwini]|uniref:Uncharacterized protein n=1 Tax=Caerostris darwini TaxID=1538125 RepID=A0AAV4NK95_9ARAC|nr:hypothetical protein CDAR_258651 [Caerostris darwini]